VNAAIAGGDSNQLTFQWSVNGQPIGQEFLLYSEPRAGPELYGCIDRPWRRFNPAWRQR
jgi:hypothetical protein